MKNKSQTSAWRRSMCWTMKVAAHGGCGHDRLSSAKAPAGQTSICLRIHQRSAGLSIRHRRRADIGRYVRPTDTGARRGNCRRNAAADTEGLIECGRFTVKMTWDEIVALYKAHARPAASMSYLLIHSMAHHVMHGIARFSGLDLGSLREVIFPADLAFVVHRARHDGRPRKYLVHVARPKRSFSPLPKLVVADDTLAYVGSANLTDAAWYRNIEAGCFFDETEMVASAMDVELREFFHRVDEHASPLSDELFRAIETRAQQL